MSHSGRAPFLGLVLFLCLPAARAVPAPGAFFTSLDAYVENEQVYAPKATIAGGSLLRNLTTARTALDCAQECLREAQCAWWGHAQCSDEQAECAGEQAAPLPLCQLFSSNCTIAPVSGTPPPPGVTSTAGFPFRGQSQDLDNWYAQPALGVLDVDLECPQSVLAGKCALRRLSDAIVECDQKMECQAVTYYRKGLDGCSEPVALLVSRPLTPDNSFASPLVSTLIKMDKGGRRKAVLLASEGTVIEPTDADLAAAAASSAPDNAWVGCIISKVGAVMAGSFVAVLDGMPTAEACCRACRNSSGAANVWNWCGQEGGCRFTVSSQTYDLKQGQCELRLNEMAELSAGFPAGVTASGPEVPLVGGAPMAVWGPQVPGFQRLTGHLQYPGVGNINCSQDVSPQTQGCWVTGTPEQVVEECRGTAGCAAAVVVPGVFTAAPEGEVTGVLTSFTNSSVQYLSPTSIIYAREQLPPPAAWATAAPPASSSSSSSSSGGGLSSGEIAGIAIGAAAAVAAAACAGWALLHRHRKRTFQDDLRSSAGSSKAARSEPTAPVASDSMPPGLGCTSVLVAGDAPEESGSSLPLTSLTDSAPAAFAAPGRQFVLAAQPSQSPFAAAAARRAASGRGLPIAAAAPGLPRPITLSRPAVPAHTVGQLSTEPGSTESESSGASMLPELALHVAHCDAALSVGSILGSGSMDGMGGGGGGGGGGASSAAPLLSEQSMISVKSMSASLRTCVVNIQEVIFVRHPLTGALQQLGSGASATAWKVRFRGETVAAKEVDLGRSPDDQKKFLAEAERLHLLRHAQVVSLYGICLSGTRGLLLMEYCSGRDLHAALHIRKAGTDQRLFGWHARGRSVILDVACALNYLHHQGVVHFDVKSSNVLLTGSGSAKLADVGLSRMTRGAAISALSTVIGTFDWMAPEVLIGAQCTPAVDCWSFGVLCWEVVTGERPKRGSMRLPRVPEECPQAVADLIMDCMQLEASLRPTALQLMQRLEALQ